MLHEGEAVAIEEVLDVRDRTGREVVDRHHAIPSDEEGVGKV